MNYILDTSAVIRLYIPDGPIPEQLEKAIHEAERGEGILCAPELLLAEAAHVIYKKKTAGLLSGDEAEVLLDAVLRLPIRYISHNELILRAFNLAAECALTVYDALFLALAEQQAGKLISADDRLHSAAERMGLA